jgi:hypothetical protein
MFEGGCLATFRKKWALYSFSFFFSCGNIDNVFHLKSFCFFFIMALAVQTSLSSNVPVVSNHSSSIRTSRAVTAKPNRSLSTKFVVDWNNPSTLAASNKTKTNDDNLQEAFRRFREQRIVC